MINKDLETLFSINFIKLSRPLIKKLGLDASVLLSELFAEYKYRESKKDLLPDDSFFSTVEMIQNNVGLSKYQQSQAIEKLCNYGIIKITYRDLPKKRYFQFQYAVIHDLLIDIELETKRSVTTVRNVKKPIGTFIHTDDNSSQDILRRVEVDFEHPF